MRTQDEGFLKVLSNFRASVTVLYTELLGSCFTHWRCSQYSQWTVSHNLFYFNLSKPAWYVWKWFLSIGSARICKGLAPLFTSALQLSECQREGSDVLCPYFSHRAKPDRLKKDSVAWHDCPKKGRFGTVQYVQSDQKNRNWDTQLHHGIWT